MPELTFLASRPLWFSSFCSLVAGLAPRADRKTWDLVGVGQCQGGLFVSSLLTLGREARKTEVRHLFGTDSFETKVWIH